MLGRHADLHVIDSVFQKDPKALDMRGSLAVDVVVALTAFDRGMLIFVTNEGQTGKRVFSV